MEDVVQLFDKVDQNREAMVDTWKLLVDRDCGSGNKAERRRCRPRCKRFPGKMRIQSLVP